MTRNLFVGLVFLVSTTQLQAADIDFSKVVAVQQAQINSDHAKLMTLQDNLASLQKLFDTKTKAVETQGDDTANKVSSLAKKSGCYTIVLNANFYTNPAPNFSLTPTNALPPGVTLEGDSRVGPHTVATCQEGYYVKGVRVWNWGGGGLDRQYCCPL